MDAVLTAQTCTVYGVNAVVLGGINIVNPCADTCRCKSAPAGSFFSGKGGVL